MLSTVLKRVKSLEQRLDKQSNTLSVLTRRVDGPLSADLDKISSVTGIKDILLRYQAKLKEHDFEMNHIKSKVTSQGENVQKITLDLMKLRTDRQRMEHDLQPQQQQIYNNREQQTQTHNNNPWVECLIGSVHPNTPMPTPLIFNNAFDQPLGTDPGLIHGFQQNYAPRSTEAMVAERCLEESAGSDSAALWHNFINNKVKLGTPVNSTIGPIMQQQLQVEEIQFQTPFQATRKLSNEPCSVMNNRSNTERELNLHKKRVVELEAECVQKDKLLQELASKQEDYKEREREFLQKIEWCEHKMRLLKQDKRRRGETIGKLLRSIDEMRDAGRLDLSRVQEGRGILATTINTRGLSNEQRIQAAINITDTEKSPRYRELLEHVRTSESSAHSMSDETDGEMIPGRGDV